MRILGQTSGFEQASDTTKVSISGLNKITATNVKVCCGYEHVIIKKRKEKAKLRATRLLTLAKLANEDEAQRQINPLLASSHLLIKG